MTQQEVVKCKVFGSPIFLLLIANVVQADTLDINMYSIELFTCNRCTTGHSLAQIRGGPTFVQWTHLVEK